MEKPKEPVQVQSGMIVFLLVVFFPLGLLFMWLQPKPTKILGNLVVRLLITGFWAAIILGAILSPKLESAKYIHAAPGSGHPPVVAKSAPPAIAPTPSPAPTPAYAPQSRADPDQYHSQVSVWKPAAIDIKAVLAALKLPLTDDDHPPTFERSDLGDGTEHWLAHQGAVIIEVMPQSASVVFGVNPGDAMQAADGILACARLCRAIFKDDKEVLHQMMAMVDEMPKKKDVAITHKGYTLTMGPIMPGLFTFKVTK